MSIYLPIKIRVKDGFEFIHDHRFLVSRPYLRRDARRRHGEWRGGYTLRRVLSERSWRVRFSWSYTNHRHAVNSQRKKLRAETRCVSPY